MAAARTRVTWVALVFAAALLAAAAHPALAQESRGSISGTVRDNSGGALPGVTVTAVQQGTNRTTSAVTSDAGSFSLLFLQPGTYTISAELSGFKKVRRENVEVRVNDRVGVDLSMEIGGIEETVTVRAETPLLETRSGSQGQIIDQRRISLLPLSDGNPFILTRLAPGIAYTGDLKFSRPFDNAGTSNVVADGAPGANEFTLDGSPNMASGGRVAFVPPSDAVQEFKVESATFDAQQGHTAGATVNVAIKSGTNNLRGTGYFFYRDDTLSTNEYSSRRPGNRSRRWTTPGGEARWAARSSRTRPSSSASSSGSTMRSRNRLPSACPRRRSGTATSPRCSPRASSSTTRPRRSSTPPGAWSGCPSRATSSRRTASARSRRTI